MSHVSVTSIRQSVNVGNNVASVAIEFTDIAVTTCMLWGGCQAVIRHRASWVSGQHAHWQCKASTHVIDMHCRAAADPLPVLYSQAVAP